MDNRAGTSDDEKFLQKCEELLKDRYTQKDEEFMKVSRAVKSTPPIVENWWVPSGSNRRYDNSRHNPYEHNQNRNRYSYSDNRRSYYNRPRYD